MTIITFNTSIPAAANNPSVDQPNMLSNNVSTNAILAVDHVTFNTSGPAGVTPGASSGQHLQVTFNGKNVPGSPTDPISVLYANNVTAVPGQNTASASTVSEVFYRNANATYPVSMIKAFGCFDGGATSLNTWNMAASNSSTGIYVVTMPANVLTGTSYLVFAMPNHAFTPGPSVVTVAVDYVINSATQFTLSFFRTSNSALTSPSAGFSVLVLQL